MSITVFSDLILSNQVLEGGMRGRQIRKNQRVSVASGFESINIQVDKTLREFDLGIGPLRRSTWQQIEAIFEVTEGGAYGFLMQDPKDSSATITEGVVAGPITGFPHTFQLFKRYTAPVSGRTKDRKITRPISGSVQAYVSGIAVSSTVDLDTGRITIASTTAASTVTWTGRFYVPVHFLNDQIDWELSVWGPDPESRYLSGPTVVVREILEGLPVL